MLEEHAPDPFRVTIIPADTTGGKTWFIHHDQPYLNYEMAMAQLTCAMGGYAAERILLGRRSYTSMTSHDRKLATQLAMQMVCEWNMGTSSSLFVSASNPFSNPQGSQRQREAQELVHAASQRAEKLLKRHVAALTATRNALLEHRTIGRDELNTIARKYCPQAILGDV